AILAPAAAPTQIPKPADSPVTAPRAASPTTPTVAPPAVPTPAPTLATAAALALSLSSAVIADVLLPLRINSISQQRGATHGRVAGPYSPLAAESAESAALECMNEQRHPTAIARPASGGGCDAV